MSSTWNCKGCPSSDQKPRLSAHGTTWDEILADAHGSESRLMRRGAAWRDDTRVEADRSRTWRVGAVLNGILGPTRGAGAGPAPTPRSRSAARPAPWEAPRGAGRGV